MIYNNVHMDAFVLFKMSSALDFVIQVTLYVWVYILDKVFIINSSSKDSKHSKKE